MPIIVPTESVGSLPRPMRKSPVLTARPSRVSTAVCCASHLQPSLTSSQSSSRPTPITMLVAVPSRICSMPRTWPSRIPLSAWSAVARTLPPTASSAAAPLRRTLSQSKPIVDHVRPDWTDSLLQHPQWNRPQPKPHRRRPMFYNHLPGWPHAYTTPSPFRALPLPDIRIRQLQGIS